MRQSIIIKAGLLTILLYMGIFLYFIMVRSIASEQLANKETCQSGYQQITRTDGYICVEKPVIIVN